MSLARPRFTIRRLMVLVAFSAVGISAWIHFSRADAFETILLSQIGGVLIAWGLIIVVIGAIATLFSRFSSPPREEMRVDPGPSEEFPGANSDESSCQVGPPDANS
jgi:hypothetical protein